MATNPKTRKTSAAKRATPKAAIKQAPREPKREVSGICGLIARAAFIKNFSPFFRNADETAGQFLSRVCNAKFGGGAGGREGLRALGVPDQDIDSENVVDLGIDALRRARDIVKEDSGR